MLGTEGRFLNYERLLAIRALVEEFAGSSVLFAWLLSTSRGLSAIFV